MPSGRGITAEIVWAGVPDKTAHFQRLTQFIRLRLMDADAPVDLVMDTDFLVHFIIIACELHPVHAQIGIHDARLLRVFGIHLGQRDESPAIVLPVLN